MVIFQKKKMNLTFERVTIKIRISNGWVNTSEIDQSWCPVGNMHEIHSIKCTRGDTGSSDETWYAHTSFEVSSLLSDFLEIRVLALNFRLKSSAYKILSYGQSSAFFIRTEKTFVSFLGKKF